MMPTARMTTRAKASANSGQQKACIRLTRCMSMTLRERISELLSAHRGGGRGGRAVDDVVLQGHGSALKARRPGPVRAADLGVEGRGGQRADLLEVEHVGPDDEGLDLIEPAGDLDRRALQLDRKSTRLNSSHVAISYAVFCLKKNKQKHMP